MSVREFPNYYHYRRIVQAKLFIDLNYSEALDVREIADEACYSKYHFIRAFKNIYGKTPHKYLTSVRIERSKELLGGGVSVTEACFSVGFDSLGSFTVLFKRETGTTPSEYRKSCLKRELQVREKPLTFVPGCFAARLIESAE